MFKQLSRGRFFVSFSDKVNVPTVSVSNRIIDTDGVNVHSVFMDSFFILSNDIFCELASQRFNVTHCRSCLRSANRECEIRIRTSRFIFSSSSVWILDCKSYTDGRSLGAVRLGRLAGAIVQYSKGPRSFHVRGWDLLSNLFCRIGYLEYITILGFVRERERPRDQVHREATTIRRLRLRKKESINDIDTSIHWNSRVREQAFLPRDLERDSPFYLAAITWSVRRVTSRRRVSPRNKSTSVSGRSGGDITWHRGETWTAFVRNISAQLVVGVIIIRCQGNPDVARFAAQLWFRLLRDIRKPDSSSLSFLCGMKGCLAVDGWHYPRKFWALSPHGNGARVTTPLLHHRDPCAQPTAVSWIRANFIPPSL